MGRVILFKGAYATLDYFTDDIAENLKKKGFEVYVFDVGDYQNALIGFAAFLQRPVDFALSYNNLGFNMELAPGQNIWNQKYIPFVNILMDHPFHYKNALEQAPADTILLCCDRNHVEYVRRFYPHIRHVYFMAHGAVPVSSGKEWKERTIDVLYAGGLSVDLTDSIKPCKEKYPEIDGDELIDYAVDRLVNDHWLLTENVIEDYLIMKHIEYTDGELSELITDFRMIDSVATSYFREKTVEELVENGIKVTVYGRGWENRKCFQNPNFIYGGLVAPSKVLELMQDSKIVLNTMTWFKAGSHDRVFNGMLAGAVSITDDSEYIREVVRQGENGYIFQLDNLKELVGIVTDVLEEKVDVLQIVENGKREAWENHLLSCRVDDILSRVDELN